MPPETDDKDVGDLLIEAIQMLAAARAERGTPDAVEQQLNQALHRLGQAFALNRALGRGRERTSGNGQRLDRVFISNEKFFSTATGNPDLDLICVDGPVPRVDASPGQLEYLLLSALFACRELAGGIRPITVTIDQVNVSLLDADTLTPLQAGDYAAIVVQSRSRMLDQIPHPTPYDDVINSIEEAENLATGLGTLQRIVDSLGGALVHDREDENCQALVIYLPMSRAIAESDESMEISAGQRHDETVLLVDDDPMVRRYTRRALEAAGFHVLEAGDSRAAIEAIREEEGRVDVLIADLVLPDMHGGKLADAIHREFGSVPVIFVSGYDNKAIQHHGLIDQGANLLQKPYTRRSLLTMVEAALKLRA